MEHRQGAACAPKGSPQRPCILPSRETDAARSAISFSNPAQKRKTVMNIVSTSERTSRKGPDDWFTGTVWIDEIAIGQEPSRVRFVRVSFEPGARTAWHTHPLGQVLHVISGSGL